MPRIQKERDTSARSSIGVRTWFSSCWFGPLRVSIPAKPVICRGDPACPSTPPGDELASVHQERACPGLRPRCFYRHKRGTKLKSSSLSCVRIGRLRLPRKNHPAPGSMLRKGHSPEKIRCLLTCSDRDKSRLRGNRTPRKSNSITSNGTSSAGENQPASAGLRPHLVNERERSGELGGECRLKGRFLHAYHGLGEVNRPEGQRIVLPVLWLPQRQAKYLPVSTFAVLEPVPTQSRKYLRRTEGVKITSFVISQNPASAH